MNEEQKLELLTTFFNDTHQYRESSYNLNIDIRDEISILSTNLEEFLTLYRSTLTKNKNEISNKVSAKDIANSISDSNNTNSNDLLKSINFNTELINQHIIDTYSEHSSLSYVNTLFNINDTLSNIHQIMLNNEKKVSNQRKIQRKIEEDKNNTEEFDKRSLKSLTIFGGTVNAVINAVLKVNKSYITKVTQFSRSIDMIMMSFKKNFSGDEGQKLMIAANTFSNFLKNYTDTISNIDTSMFKKSKVKIVLDTFELFEQMKASETSIDKAAKIAETMLTFAEGIDKFLTVLRKTKVPSQNKVDRITKTIRNFIVDVSDTLKSANIKKAGQISEILDGIGKGILSFAKRMMISSPIFVLAAPGIAAFKLTMKFLMPEFNYLAKNGQKIYQGGLALKNVGQGILWLSGSIYLSTKIFTKMSIQEAVIGVTSILGVGWLFTKFFITIGKNQQKVKAGLKTTFLLGAATLTLTGTLYLMSITPLNLKNISKSILAVSGLTLLYNYIGNTRISKRISKGAMTIGLMGASMMMLSLPLTIIAQTLHENGDVLWKLPIFLSGTALIYNIVGKGAISIAKGAGAFALIGASMILLSFPLVTIAKTLHENGDVLWKLPVLLLGLGTVYSLAGTVMPLIASGALAFATIGLSLWTLYHPLSIIAPTLKENGDVLWKLPVLLLGLGTVYSLAGTVMPLIVAGSVAFGAMGVSLSAISSSIKTVSETDISIEKANLFATSLKTVVKGYAEAMSEIKLLDIAKIPIMNKISNSMETFSRGMKSWQETIGLWTNEDTAIMSNLILSATSSMIIATSPDYIKKKFGIDVSAWGMWKGIRATMSLGKNLNKLAEGVRTWKDMKLSEEDAKSITANINQILGILPYSIAKVGRMYDSDDWTNAWGLFRKKDKEVDDRLKSQYINGEIYSLRELKLGLDYTEDLSDILMDLAKGVKYWKEAKITNDDMIAINTNIKTILEFLPYSIAKVGKFYDPKLADNAAKLVYNNGKSYTREEIKYGIKYSQQIGDVLNSLAKGVKYWTEAKVTQNDVIKITQNVDTILQTLPATIAKIGKEDGQIKNVGFLGLWSKTDTQRGIDYVKGIGDSLESLTNGVKYWIEAKLSPDDVKNIQKNVTNIITTIPSVFAEVGRSKDTDKGFWGIFKSDAEKGIKIVDKLSKPFGNMADIVTKFNTIPDPKTRAEQIGQGVRQMLKDTVAGLSSLNTTNIELFDKFIDPFQKFTDILIKFTKEIKEIGTINWKEFEPLLEHASTYEINRQTLEQQTWDKRRQQTLDSRSMGSFNPNNLFVSNVPSPKKSESIIAKKEEQQNVQMVQMFSESIETLKEEISSLKTTVIQINNKLIKGNKGGLKVEI